ncbi:DUF2304 domain-containing protein [Gordonia sp. (in: high G+C Gram-positive bacteria)]|jgi:hypothetical protein|uniref:DUF2304 domain-containing protein n=1 Tax=Gordonia sp. (in: high G+C Gram-positive bacteria) TaxID=84139 RepID=UPI001D44C960|nr:DUF2304 domain-containing protein [Gordonia sp. (in: high G+C Gram-positive bacteria)]MCB1296400.1 DUF2304 domain-containing protein [Gordonia sp. (in: high G+C Gram-positive bacteria)]HMS77306.1 DUF2304 domain-containing protein [Gordonia sp. (in: high G+C Gram-positive bacteria)]HQV18775.1 DUF2304 domain-containing protein [Gordonia sp. (in: high G+C Gram-positive bacteria)]
MLVIQIVLIAAAAGLVWFFVTNRGNSKASAGFKLLFVAFVMLGVYAMIRPDDLTVVAGWVDVGRGTDLMLYCLIIAFAFTTVASYLRFRELEIRFARLARVVALQNADAEDRE